MTAKLVLSAALVLGLVGTRAAGQEPISPAKPATFYPEGGVFPEAGEAGGEGAERDRIETDRDSFTPTTKTVGLRRLMIESAYTYSLGRDSFSSHSYPELLLRYGLFERVELRLGWNYEAGSGPTVSGFPGNSLESESERASRILYGFKAGLLEQSGWVPEAAVIVRGATPTSGPETATHLGASLVWGWTLPNDWLLDSAVQFGTDSEKQDHFSTWHPSVVLKVPVGRRWTAHAEYFGGVSAGKEEGFTHHFFSPGAHYLITPDFEVGVRVGWGLNDQSARFFANLGFGFRL